MSGCSCHVETIAPLVMMSNYQNEAEIREHVFGKEPLRPPHAARSRAQLCAAIRDRRDPRSPRHGLESPCHVARAFQPVRLGRAVRSVRPRSSAVRPPSDFCDFCAFLRPTLRRPSSAVSRPIRFLRLLRFFAANPPLAVFSRRPSVVRRPSSHPILAPFAPLGGQPSAVRSQPSVFRRQPSHPILAPFALLCGQLNRATSCTCGPPPPPAPDQLHSNSSPTAGTGRG